MEEADKPWAWVFKEKVTCTACWAQVNPFGEWHSHPKLKTIQCADCNQFYHKGNLISKKFIKFLYFSHIRFRDKKYT